MVSCRDLMAHLHKTVLTSEKRKTTIPPTILMRISTRAMNTTVVRTITVATPLTRKNLMSVMISIPWTTIMGTMMNPDCRPHIWDFSLPPRFVKLASVKKYSKKFVGYSTFRSGEGHCQQPAHLESTLKQIDTIGSERLV